MFLSMALRVSAFAAISAALLYVGKAHAEKTQEGRTKFTGADAVAFVKSHGFSDDQFSLSCKTTRGVFTCTYKAPVEIADDNAPTLPGKVNKTAK